MIVGYMVRVVLPDDSDTERCQDDLHSLVEYHFDSDIEVSLQYILSGGPPKEDPIK
jgi:hypothetical protein